MSYRVGWKRSAENHLADIWTNASDRQEVADAANRIERMLERDPHACGESRGGSRYVTIEEPLAVLYKVDDDDLFVHVLKVWRVPVSRGTP